MKKHIVEYSTVNPAYEEGHKMWKAVIVLAAIIVIALIF